MKRLVCTMMMTMAIGAVTSMGLLHAQKTTQTSAGTGGSPHVKTEWTIDGADLVVEYGRPSLKGRPEAQLMPPGRPWRMGADEPTLLTTNKPLKFGTLALAPGTYTLNAIAGPSEWQLLVGKYQGPGQWGIPYQPALEIGRVPMTLGKTAAPVEQVTIHIDDTAAGATLRVEWGTASATTPFTVG